MTDDLDPSRLLASAALDDEVTADERAMVGSSQELRDALGVYTGLSDELRSVEVPAAARESAVAAALAAFDALSVADGPVTTPVTMPVTTSVAGRAPLAPVVSLHARRQRQMRWLGGAAAAAVVGVLTVGAITSTSGGDSKSSSATVAAPIAAKEPASAGAADSAAPALESAATTAASTGETTAAANAPAAESAAGQVGDTTLGAGNTAAVAPVDPWSGAPSIITPEQLVAFATDIPSVLASTQMPATTAATDTVGAAAADTTAADLTADSTADSTVAERVADSAAYQACVSVSGRPSAPAIYRGARVIVERDDVAGVVVVVDPDGCAVLDRLPIPAP